MGDVSGERVFVAMYGLTLLAIRILLFAVDEYSYKERLYAEWAKEEKDAVRRTILPVVTVYVVAILLGLILPGLAVALYCVLAIYPSSRSRKSGNYCSTARELVCSLHLSGPLGGLLVTCKRCNKPRLSKCRKELPSSGNSTKEGLWI
jgi:ABC-type Fe3+ transport system permease subunit